MQRGLHSYYAVTRGILGVVPLFGRNEKVILGEWHLCNWIDI